MFIFRITALDSENDLLTYHWMCSDGLDEITNYNILNHTFDSPGDYQIFVKVSDGINQEVIAPVLEINVPK